MKAREIEFMMEIAKLAAARSHAIRTKVGAVLTDSNGNMISYAYNGTISGTSNVCERKIYESDDLVPNQSYPYTSNDGSEYRLETLDDVLHAEQNLLAHAARRGIPVAAGTVLVTLSPCARCTAQLIQAGIREIVYLDRYRLHSQVEEKYGRFIKLTQFGVAHE